MTVVHPNSSMAPAERVHGLAQPLAPCALSLEGTVLGASQITWVGGRTVLSAIASCSLLALSASQVPETPQPMN